MKKLLTAIILVFITGISCKKNDSPIGCDIPVVPHFYLVVKDQNGVDLLNDSVPGSFKQSDIQITGKNKKGETLKLRFEVSTWLFGGGQKFPYRFINLDYSTEVQNPLQVKLGNQVYKLNRTLKNPGEVDQILFDQNPLQRDTTENFRRAPIFYLTP
jgi:hypothetical protein